MSHAALAKIETPSEQFVSIGLPVRNGAATLTKAITSLLHQRHADFELIISDNDSTDDTASICRSFADPRIRYFRQANDIGAVANFIFTLEQARGHYFMWAAADDFWLPDCLSDNLTVLHNYPHVAGSLGQVLMGDERCPRRLGNFPIVGKPITRMRRLLSNPGYNCRSYGLFRREQLQSSIAREEFVAWDWANMIRIAGLGEFHVVDQVHVIRGCDGASRHPDYRGKILFLWPFTRWLWRELSFLQFVNLTGPLVFQNLKFNIAWLTIRRALETQGPAQLASKPSFSP